MTATTVTFAVQIGSGGFDIAMLAAERLEYRYYDWEVTSEAAERAGVSPEMIQASEHAQSLLERVMSRLVSTGVYDDNVPVGRLSASTMSTAIQMLSSREHRDMIERIVEELAEQERAVIVGHASQIVLKDRPGVLRTLICGSEQRRAERLAGEEHLDAETALATVRASDRERRSFFKQIYGVNLLEGSLYDIVINTDHITPAVATGLVLNAARSIPG